MSKESDNKHSKKILWCLLSIVVIIVSMAALWFIFKPKTNYVQPDDQSFKTVTLDCNIEDSPEAFFDSSGATKAIHQIKQTFKEGKVDSISYIFDGTYGSIEEAENMSATMQAEYNIYMGEHDQSQGSLSPVFAALNSSLKITLFADKTNINNATSILFFLTPNEYQRFNTRSLENTKKLYENKGFSCQIYD